MTVSIPTVHRANRSLPGFQTILQCGKTLDDDTLLGKTVSNSRFPCIIMSMLHASANCKWFTERHRLYNLSLCS